MRFLNDLYISAYNFRLEYANAKWFAMPPFPGEVTNTGLMKNTGLVLSPAYEVSIITIKSDLPSRRWSCPLQCYSCIPGVSWCQQQDRIIRCCLVLFFITLPYVKQGHYGWCECNWMTMSVSVCRVCPARPFACTSLGWAASEYEQSWWLLSVDSTLRTSVVLRNFVPSVLLRCWDNLFSFWTFSLVDISRNNQSPVNRSGIKCSTHIWLCHLAWADQRSRTHFN